MNPAWNAQFDFEEENIIRTRTQTPSKPEFQLVLEFIGLRNLIIIGFVGSLYFLSGIKNFIEGQPFLQSFSPYYALHFHDGGLLIDRMSRAFWSWVNRQQDLLWGYVVSVLDKIKQLFQESVQPFLSEHPFLGIILIVSLGFALTIVGLATVLVLIKKLMHFFALTRVVSLPGSRHHAQHMQETWSFDPHKRPSEDQLKITLKNLEKLVQRAPVLGGHVPKNADSSLRDLARRNKDSEYHYRNAIYVMGPIKGTKYDNQYELPIALDPVKKISSMMSQAAEYETLPLDLVILRAKKGSNNWEVEPSIAPVSLGISFPVKVIEKCMIQYRNTFIWDQRATKPRTGYGTR